MLIVVNGQNAEQLDLLEDFVLTLAERLISEESMRARDLAGKSLEEIAHMIHPGLHIHRLSELEVAYLKKSGLPESPFPEVMIGMMISA